MAVFGTIRHYLSVVRASFAEEKAEGKRPTLKRDEREFQAAAIEIMETPPSPAGRLLGLALITLLVIALVWSIIGRIDIFATLQGKVIPNGHVKVIEPLITGKILAIHVRQGERVKEGETLIELDPTVHQAERMRLEEELAITAAVSVRLRAAMLAVERNVAPDKVAVLMPDTGPDSVQQLQRDVLRRTLAAYRAEQERLASEAYQKTMELKRTGGTVAERERLVEVMTERLDMLDALVKKGSASRATWLERAELLYEQRADLATDKGKLAEIEAGIKALKERAGERRAAILQELVKELADNEKRLTGLRQEVRKARVREAQSTLYAPVAGTVQQLAVHTLGDVVTTGQQLMVIVPAGTALEVEAMLLNRDKGFVRAGQTARIKVETFPFTKYGIIPGAVVDVSNDAVSPEQLTRAQAGGQATPAPAGGTAELVFPVRIALGRETIRVEGEDVRLSPGMAVAAEVKTGDRRIIEFVLSPLLRLKDESLKER